MGEHLFFSDVRRDDESASLFDRSPLSAGSSPSPLLLGKAPAKTMPTARMHVIARFICAPFTAVFSMKCARASSSDDELINSDMGGMKRGVARRPSLEELLRMEEVLPSFSRHKSTTPQDMAVSCCLKEHAIVVLGLSGSTSISCALKEEPLSSLSKSPRTGTGDEERHMAIVPVKVDVGGSPPTASPAVPISASPRRRALLQALTLRLDIIGRTTSRYRKLDGSCAVSKPELFYQRPIPMGRRCRVQHLEESPYV